MSVERTVPEQASDALHNLFEEASENWANETHPIKGVTVNSTTNNCLPTGTDMVGMRYGYAVLNDPEIRPDRPSITQFMEIGTCHYLDNDGTCTAPTHAGEPCIGVSGKSQMSPDGSLFIVPSPSIVPILQVAEKYKYDPDHHLSGGVIIDVDSELVDMNARTRKTLDNAFKNKTS